MNTTTDGHPGEPAPAPIRTLVLDRTAGFRTRLEAVLAGAHRLEVVASTRDGDTAIACARDHRPDLAIVDPAGLDAPADLLDRLRRAAPGVRIVVLSALPDHTLDTLRPHADLVLVKGIHGGRLVDALAVLAAG